MAELAWTVQSAPGPALVDGRSGEAAGKAGIRLAVVTDIRLFQVMARRGQWQATAKAAEACFGTRPPERPGASFAPGVDLVWSGPDQFLALTGTRTSDNIQAFFAGIASLSDQSHGRALFRVAGPKARDMLAKVSSLDLDPLVFPAGSAAMTSIDHTGVTLWCESGDSGGSVYHLLVFTSFAGTLWRLLVDSAAEFGAESSSGVRRSLSCDADQDDPHQ